MDDFIKEADINREHFEKIRLQVRVVEKEVLAGGPLVSRERHKKRGKLFARDRINGLIDIGTAFFEIGRMAGYELYDDPLPSAGLVTGIGIIHGSPCAIYANDATVKGGSYYPVTLKKHLRMQDIARKQELPSIYLVDSGGVYLPMQEEVFPGEGHLGKIFKNTAEMSALGLPQIAAVMGVCTAGGAYIPTMCDEVVMVHNTGQIFLGGPQLVKAATGIEVEAEELGGAKIHTSISGVADHFAHSDEEAISILRKIVARASLRKIRLPDISPRKPKLNIETLPEYIPALAKTPMIAKEILDRILDNSELFEYKREYGTSIVCGTGFIEGYQIGVIANDGVLFTPDTLKATNFIELCAQRNIPLLFVHNINGFMVGKRYEEEGLAKHGAKLINAVACAQIPKISLIIGGSYGAGNFAMCGRSMDPDLLAMWPNSKTSVVGAEQAAEVMVSMKVAAAEKRGEKLSEEEIKQVSDSIRSTYEKQANALYAAARLWTDAIVDPEDTREWLSLVLSMLPERNIATKFGVFRM